MTQDIASLLAQRFISRRDAKAIQKIDGGYAPVRDRSTSTDVGWSMRDIADHLNGGVTYGHYLLDGANQTKLMCFDCDLIDKPAKWVWQPDIASLGDTHYDQAVLDQWFTDNTRVYDTASPREDWRDRAHPGRAWYKLHMRLIADRITTAVRQELDIPAIAAYTGNKGVHVYGLTGKIPASQARLGAELVMKSLHFEHVNGSWIDTNQDPHDSNSLFTVEVYPKQDTVGEGGYGNLVRLPLGRNMKNTADPTFFIDQRRALNELMPHPDPAGLLASGNPWKD